MIPHSGHFTCLILLELLILFDFPKYCIELKKKKISATVWSHWTQCTIIFILLYKAAIQRLVAAHAWTFFYHIYSHLTLTNRKGVQNQIYNISLVHTKMATNEKLWTRSTQNGFFMEPLRRIDFRPFNTFYGNLYWTLLLFFYFFRIFFFFSFLLPFDFERFERMARIALHALREGVSIYFSILNLITQRNINVSRAAVYTGSDLMLIALLSFRTREAANDTARRWIIDAFYRAIASIYSLITSCFSLD